jgi:ABC-type uncharacterized transport system substrate-binding protein
MQETISRIMPARRLPLRPARLLACLALALLPCLASAHPHARFTYQLEPVVRGDAIVALTVRWQLDPLTSLLALRGLDFNRNGQADPDELDAFARQNDALVAAAGYFLRLGDAEQALAFTVTRGLTAQVQAQRLQLAFEVALATPRVGSLAVRLFDESWYVALSADDPPVPAGHPCEGTVQAQPLATQGWGTQLVPVVQLSCRPARLAVNRPSHDNHTTTHPGGESR